VCHYIRPIRRKGADGIRSGARIRVTYREVWGGGPGGLAVDIADEGLVNVTSADEAVTEVRDVLHAP
jgi:hypothetical protein